MTFRAEERGDVQHKPYITKIEQGVETHIYTEYPPDELIAQLTYATDLREIAVIDKRLFNRPIYLSPEELQGYNFDWQNQCHTTEWAIRYGEDLNKR